MNFKLKTIMMAVGVSSMLLASAGCATMDTGSEKAKTAATGSAGGSNTQNANA